mmetsp:Transcript_71334/g.167105  ORF Transcript_71334/g.167105 Transcript_71334/m.167105 type:complete len:91 (-) Transcript_71334:698-970(-)
MDLGWNKYVQARVTGHDALVLALGNNTSSSTAYCNPARARAVASAVPHSALPSTLDINQRDVASEALFTVTSVSSDFSAKSLRLPTAEAS